MHAGLGKDPAGMSRVWLDALDLPAVEEEPGGRSVRLPAEIVCRRVTLTHRLSPGRRGHACLREAGARYFHGDTDLPNSERTSITAGPSLASALESPDASSSGVLAV